MAAVDAMAAVELYPDEPLRAELESVRRLLRRVRLDIHDGALQELAVVSTDLCLLREELALEAEARGLPAGLVERAERVAARVDDVIDDLRDLAVAARRSLRARQSLEDVIRRTAELYSGTCELDVLVAVDDSSLSESQRIAIERIVQTALANVARHSGATVASVTVRQAAEGTLVEVSDDGRGFDVEACLRRAADQGRLGLRAVLERVGLLGGQVEIESTPGGPSRVSALIPPARAHGPRPVSRPPRASRPLRRGRVRRAGAARLA